MADQESPSSDQLDNLSLSEVNLSTDSGTIGKKPDEGKETGSSFKSESEKEKINILLKATSNAPILKNATWHMYGDKSVGSFISFLRKYMKLKPTETLFVYVNQMFAPTPDQTLQALYDCFSCDGKLILHYCMTPAWG